jgi:hypothetical protein
MPLQPAPFGQSAALMQGCVQCMPFALKLKQSMLIQSAFVMHGAPNGSMPPELVLVDVDVLDDVEVEVEVDVLDDVEVEVDVDVLVLLDVLVEVDDDVAVVLEVTPLPPPPPAPSVEPVLLPQATSHAPLKPTNIAVRIVVLPNSRLVAVARMPLSSFTRRIGPSRSGSRRDLRREPARARSDHSLGTIAHL